MSCPCVRQAAAERLATENRGLRKLHQRLSDEVVGLMGIDLLRQREAWKAKWTGMKDMVTALAKKKSYPPEQMAKWLLHWDYQVPCRRGIASHRITSHHIASHRIASHRIASHRIASHHITSHRITSAPLVTTCRCLPPLCRHRRRCRRVSRQLYKALEVGYCMGLESLNESLSEIKAELVFAQKQLQV